MLKIYFQNFFDKCKIFIAWNFFIAKIILNMNFFSSEAIRYSSKLNRAHQVTNIGLSSDFGWLRSTNHVKFAKKCVICTDKYVSVKKCMQMAKYGFTTMSLCQKDSS